MAGMVRKALFEMSDYEKEDAKRILSGHEVDGWVDSLKIFIEEWCSLKGIDDVNYPIEGSLYDYINNDAKWDKRTKYGKLRYQLLDYLIERAKEEGVYYEH